MNWKHHFEEIKIGDKVKLVKFHTGNCNDGECCKRSYTLNTIYEVSKIEFDNTSGIYQLNGRRCVFPKECLQKV